jgi:hypothetical protein
MKCLVCFATWAAAEHASCPQCGYDPRAPGAADPARVLAAREEFKHASTAHAPHTRVTRFDRVVPWLGLALGLSLFVFWVRTCTG